MMADSLERKENRAKRRGMHDGPLFVFYAEENLYSGSEPAGITLPLCSLCRIPVQRDGPTSPAAPCSSTSAIIPALLSAVSCAVGGGVFPGRGHIPHDSDDLSGRTDECQQLSWSQQAVIFFLSLHPSFVSATSSWLPGSRSPRTRHSPWPTSPSASSRSSPHRAYQPLRSVTMP